ncbi:alpha carbonic anhydrase 1, chloroplastic-like [Ananas comosus]|uniref:Alpha carbonic anhydrase 1, chloroplastic-like n=1 Tax=Ananas comosus TaxID=4615 RepID=A0A6P5GEZ5_ANACO|nr:alpha carbonic anhydrase 1, chloroplastic-like [Ananas comosus]
MAMAIHNAIFALLASSFLVAFSSAHDFVRFGYNDGSTGPKNWGSLSPEFSLCTKGSNQSPINIVKDDAVYNAKLGSLLRDYVATNATLINNGFNVGVCSSNSIFFCGAQLKDKLAELAQVSCSEDEEAQVSVGGPRTKSFKRRSRKYFRYIGSLTTPPCTENVIWNVLGKVRELTKEQANLITAPLPAEYKNNSRPTQPLNGRTVEFFDEARYYGSKSH